MRVPVLLLLATILAGCGSSTRAGATGDLFLAVDPSSAGAGSTVELTLGNRSGGQVGYNLCTSGLERRSGSGWVRVPSDRVCTMELRMLAPGADARYDFELPRGLAPGEYRAVTGVERMGSGGRVSVVSHTFQVRG